MTTPAKRDELCFGLIVGAFKQVNEDGFYFGDDVNALYDLLSQRFRELHFEEAIKITENGKYHMILSHDDIPFSDRDKKVRQQARNEVANALRLASKGEQGK